MTIKNYLGSMVATITFCIILPWVLTFIFRVFLKECMEYDETDQKCLLFLYFSTLLIAISSTFYVFIYPFL